MQRVNLNLSRGFKRSTNETTWQNVERAQQFLKTFVCTMLGTLICSVSPLSQERHLRHYFAFPNNVIPFFSAVAL